MTEPAVTPVADGPRPPARLALLGLGVVAADLLGLYGYMGRREYLLDPVWIYLFLYAVAFGLYVYAAGRLVPRLPRDWARFAVPLIIGAGVLFRLAVLAAPPSLSTDMYRYVWDGRLTLHGINPYRWTPNAQSLRWLRDGIWENMEYKPYQTIYMPVSQAFFALGNALFGNNLIGYKFVYFLFDVGVMGLLLLLLRHEGRLPTQIIWYAWCPLPITEISLAGHQDIVGVFFLLLAFLLVRRPGTQWAGALALAAAALTKGFALLLLPLFCRTYGWRFTVAAAVSLLYLGLPVMVYLPEFLHGMTQYLNNVHVNAGLFHWVNMALSPLTRYHYQVTARLSDLAILGVTLWAARTPAPTFPLLVRRSFVVLAVTLLVVPTLFPWYLVWVLPFMALLGRRPSWAFVLLTGLVVLLYTFYIAVKAYWWTALAEYGPFYAVLAWEYARWRRAQGRPLRLREFTERLTPRRPSPALEREAPPLDAA